MKIFLYQAVASRQYFCGGPKFYRQSGGNLGKAKNHLLFWLHPPHTQKLFITFNKTHCEGFDRLRTSNISIYSACNLHKAAKCRHVDSPSHRVYRPGPWVLLPYSCYRYILPAGTKRMFVADQFCKPRVSIISPSWSKSTPSWPNAFSPASYSWLLVYRPSSG